VNCFAAAVTSLRVHSEDGVILVRDLAAVGKIGVGSCFADTCQEACRLLPTIPFLANFWLADHPFRITASLATS
jgi:hypothetical protein